jgi:antitoxin (DNA-binding transcriptional repressor) of toxin-antitoxin stability system
MKRITASEARRNWFRLLDEVAQGEKFVIERRGRRIVVLCEETGKALSAKETRSYAGLLQVPDADRADRWSWKWTEAGLELQESP